MLPGMSNVVLVPYRSEYSTSPGSLVVVIISLPQVYLLVLPPPTVPSQVKLRQLHNT